MDIPNQPQPEQNNPLTQSQVPPIAQPLSSAVPPQPQPAIIPPPVQQPVVVPPVVQPQKKSRVPLFVAIVLIVVFGGLVLVFKPYAYIKFYVKPASVAASPSPSPTGLDPEAQAIVNQFQTAVQAGFLGQIAKGNIQKIYDEASPYLRQTVTLATLRQYIDAHPILKTNPAYELIKITPVSLTVGSTTVSGVQLIGNLGTSTAGMMQNKLELQMLVENNTYLLSMIRAYAEQVLLSTSGPYVTPKP